MSDSFLKHDSYRPHYDEHTVEMIIHLNSSEINLSNVTPVHGTRACLGIDFGSVNDDNGYGMLMQFLGPPGPTKKVMGKEDGRPLLPADEIDPEYYVPPRRLQDIAKNRGGESTEWHEPRFNITGHVSDDSFHRVQFMKYLLFEHDVQFNLTSHSAQLKCMREGFTHHLFAFPYRVKIRDEPLSNYLHFED